MESINQTLNRLRDKLLDLTYRNSLLNFTHPKKSSLRIIDELPNQIFESLISGSKMAFQSVPEPTEKELIKTGYITIDPHTQERVELKDFPKANEWAEYLGLDTSYTVPSNYVEGREDKHKDTLIQTLLYPSDMEVHLRNIFSRTNTTLNETGANILYLCLGFLRWEDNSKKGLSPLFTIPVVITKGNLNKKKGVYEYTIKHTGEDIIENLSLREKLKRDFNLALPVLEEEEPPEKYFKKVGSFIQRHKPNWKVERFITLGLLNFQKSLMYRDLDPSRWEGENSILKNELVNQIIFGVEKEGESSGVDYIEDYDIDSYGEQIHNNYPLLFDADSSQHSAIIDAIEGKSMVIEGPPGTGKSQTISNLIAAALSKGKSVLFMAEKQAALNVVFERLTSVGLQDFCLNLHSKETNKKDIMESLKRRIRSRHTYEISEDYHSKISRYEQLKNELNKYVELINSTWNNTDLTVNQILNSAAANKHLINDEILDLGLEFESVNKQSISNAIEELNSFIRISNDILKNYDKGSNIIDHSWFGFNNKDFQSYDAKRIQSSLKGLNDSLKKFLDLDNQLKNQYKFYSGFLDYRVIPEVCPVIDRLLEMSVKFDFDQYQLIDPQKISKYEDCIVLYVHLTQAKNVLSENTGNFDFTSDLNKADSNIADVVDLIDNERSLNDLIKLEENLQQIKAKTKDICTIFNEINQLLGGDYLQFTYLGIEELKKIIQCVQSIPQVCIPKRDDLFDSENTFELFSSFKKEFDSASELATELSEIYTIENTPEGSRILAIQNVLSDKSIFRWFKKEYRDAKQEIQGFAANPYLKVPKLIQPLNSLVNLKKKIKKLNSKKYTNTFGSYVNGLDSDVEIIEGLINWYQSLIEVFGDGFGELYKTRNALKNVGDSELVALSNLISTNEVKSIKNVGEEILECIQFFNDKNDSFLRNSIDKLLDSFIDISKKAISHLSSIIFLATPDSSLSIFIHRLKLYDEYLHAKKEWEEYDEEIYFNDLDYLNQPENFQKVKDTIEFLSFLNNDIDSELSNHLFKNLSRKAFDELSKINFSIKDAHQKFSEKLNDFKEIGEIDLNEWSGFDYSPSKLLTKNQNALNLIEELDDLVEYLRILHHMGNLGLSELCKYAANSGKIDNLVNIYKAIVFENLALKVLANDKDLSTFSPKMHTQKIKEFREVDEKLKELNIGLIQKNIDSDITTVQGSRGSRVADLTEMNLIANEISKKTRHIPLRSLIARASKSITSLKPCFLMSPMSVSQYLTPGKQIFDIVIMDEASQIRPEDAIGTIARGKQVVIVGDPKQLPPTSFFARGLDENDDDDQTILEGQESILDAALRIFDLRTLRWHYRSRHESLIAFSNYSFYDDNLIVFPSPVTDKTKLGIQYTKVEQGSFHNKRNLQEAQVVAKAIKKHLMTSEESLGVVAMNIYQMKAIEEALLILAKESNDKFSTILDTRYNQEKEPFFVKNLENVQGDERDVMFISFTYGGTGFFGLNRENDWRRLNVLLTRAKLRMHVFSSFSSYDVPSDHSSKGIRSLNKFLRYCETGEIIRTISNTNRAPDSEFEISVMELLKIHGYDCVPQVGEAGFFIDVSVRDPDFPGEYLMGIECDGATYHSSKSARDRDRLKQQVLEGLGWKIRRIWSTDWFRNPQRALNPILNELSILKEKNKERHKEYKDKVIENPISKEDEVFDYQEYKNNQQVETTVREDTESEEVHMHDFSDLKKCIEKQLNAFAIIIGKEFPDTEPVRRLLSKNMIKHLAEEAPADRDEFESEIPEYIREVIDSKEKNKYLVTVLNIINDCIENE